jgi:hypothetical protein
MIRLVSTVSAALRRLRPSSRLSTLAVALAVFLGIPALARADLLDKELLKRSEEIMKQLRQKGYRNVGVLKFEAQVGDAKPQMLLGRINTVMATRLENALILANDEDNLIGVTRSASDVAATRDRGATFRTAEGQAKLLAGMYPLAWGKEQVKVDAFLTGLVRLSADRQTTTVTVECFDAKSQGKREQLVEFSLPTTRSVLTDLNMNFLLAKRQLKGGVTIEKFDETAAQSAVGGGSPTKTDEVKPEPNETLEKLVEFQAYYGKKAFTPDADGRLPPPEKGQPVYFTVRAREKLGLVLLVNGVNTLEGESKREPHEYSMWVLEKDKPYTIRGFYFEDKDGPKTADGKVRVKLKEFKVIPEEELKTIELVDESRIGQIKLYLFRQAESDVEVVPDIRRRGFLGIEGQGQTFQDVRKQLRQTITRGVPRRNPIVPGETEKQRDLNAVSLPNAVLAGHRTITYFERGQK